jgi:hypothetical protein
MKYTGKWWDNPRRNEDERQVASMMAKLLTGLLVILGVLVLISNL